MNITIGNSGSDAALPSGGSGGDGAGSGGGDAGTGAYDTDYTVQGGPGGGGVNQSGDKLLLKGKILLAEGLGGAGANTIGPGFGGGGSGLGDAIFVDSNLNFTLHAN